MHYLAHNALILKLKTAEEAVRGDSISCCMHEGVDLASQMMSVNQAATITTGLDWGMGWYEWYGLTSLPLSSPITSFFTVPCLLLS